MAFVCRSLVAALCLPSSLFVCSQIKAESSTSWIVTIVVVTAMATVLLHLVLCMGSLYCQRQRRMSGLNQSDSLTLAGEWSMPAVRDDDSFS